MNAETLPFIVHKLAYPKKDGSHRNRIRGPRTKIPCPPIPSPGSDFVYTSRPGLMTYVERPIESRPR